MKYKIEQIIKDVNTENILLHEHIDENVYKQLYTSKDKNFTTREIFSDDGVLITDLSRGVYSFGKLIKFNNLFFNCYKVNNESFDLVVTNKANLVNLTSKAKSQIDYNYNSCDISIDKNSPSKRILKPKLKKFSSLLEFAEHYRMYNSISTSLNRYTRECFVIDVDFDCDKIKDTINSIMDELITRGLTPSCIQKHLTNNHIQFFWFFDEPKQFKIFKNNDLNEMKKTIKSLSNGLYEYSEFTLLTKGDEIISEEGDEYKYVYLQLGSIFSNLFDKNFKGWKIKNPFFQSPEFESIFFDNKSNSIEPESYKDVLIYSFNDIKNKLSDIVINSNKEKLENILTTSDSDFVSTEETELGRNDTVLVESRKICHKNLLAVLKKNKLKSQKDLSIDIINQLKDNCYKETYKSLFKTVNTNIFKGTKKKSVYTKAEFDATFNCSFEFVFNNFDINKTGKSKYTNDDTKRAAIERQNENTIKFINAFKYLNSIKKRKSLNKKERCEIINNVIKLTGLSKSCVNYFIKNKFLKLSKPEFQKLFVLAINDYKKRKSQLLKANNINDIWCLRSYEHQDSNKINNIYNRSNKNKEIKSKRFDRISIDENLIQTITVDITDFIITDSFDLFSCNQSVNIIEPPPKV